MLINCVLIKKTIFVLCQNSSCKHCWATYLFERELLIKRFNRDNSTGKRWRIFYLKKKRSEVTVVKYCRDSEYPEELFQASEDASSYDLFGAQNMTLLPISVTSITASLNMAFPKGYFGKIYLRSGLLKNHFISCDGGMTDAYIRDIVAFLMTNNRRRFYTVRIDERIVQIALHKRIDVGFQKVDNIKSLGETVRGEGVFGSTGNN